MKKLKKGFTFIELMTVIAIIGILTAIVLPNLNNARIKGRDAKRISDIKSIQLALAIYYDTHRATGYPLSLAALGSGYSGYLPSIPIDPVGNVAYKYSALGSGTFCSGYHLAAVVEGTVASGSEDVDAVPGTICSRSAVSGSGEVAPTGAVFHGITAACSGTSAVSPAADDKCYDVTP